MSLLGKDLIGLEGLSREQITAILDVADPLKAISERAIKKVPTLRGMTVVNLFFEASTRTRISFEFAEKRMSADTVNVATAVSSVSKGETLVDTARNLEAMKIDMVVIRHPASGAPRFLADRIESNVINAGDGTHEHPTQGLLERDPRADVRIGALPVTAAGQGHRCAGLVAPTLGRGQEVVVVHRVHVPGQDQLLLVAGAGGTRGLGLGLGQRRQEHARQDRDDGDDHEQLDEGESGGLGGADRGTGADRQWNHGSEGD